MNRFVTAGIAVVILASLLVWQNHRWAMMNKCVERGGVWDGLASKCRLVPARIFIEKNLKRS
ncbi:MAG: hypothetical protein ACR2PA_20570 [Hyphomicrobiaceae bacterium]